MSTDTSSDGKEKKSEETKEQDKEWGNDPRDFEIKRKEWPYTMSDEEYDKYFRRSRW